MATITLLLLSGCYKGGRGGWNNLGVELDWGFVVAIVIVIMLQTSDSFSRKVLFPRA